MVATVPTVAYLGLEARSVEVQASLIAGLPAFNVVRLGDKAVTESRERVRGAIASLGLSLPPKRITVNLSPADLPKEGSHYDLPIALAVERLAEAGLPFAVGLGGDVGHCALAFDQVADRVPVISLVAEHDRARCKSIEQHQRGGGVVRLARRKAEPDRRLADRRPHGSWS